ncbi:nucleotidyl transferase AbiEii/AbiGii toxin family protein [Blastopirellula marina]|uniref:Nucleotidyl transferase AbiEii/AbiGii toxin family protein n=1 Tax=Blastopirellula marina TaxID=124 RepID=A0A2S8GLD7_9BACT|nr:nucleotidyl transferase AbiEii/AbiGii toxin family protein [Blastopirellula marina]PQO45246.1 nucleotidyl transferase AbiEii/AbiGii toxin family protein [Blastopirellula marina]
MTDKPKRDLSASVRARLLNLAKSNGEAYDSVLVRFALERLLYRLSQSTYRDRFVVKGAIMFQVWTQLTHRPTRDLDLLGKGLPDIDSFVAIFRELCDLIVEDDGIVFSATSVTASKMKEDEEYEGLRVKFEATLGSARIPVQVDIGFGDAVTPGSEMIEFPTLLNMPAPELATYPRETVVAEKFQAMVMLGMANSRMKDFYDLFTLCSQFSFNGQVLADAIQATFARRRTPLPSSPPLALTAEFTEDKQKSKQWIAFLNKSKLDAHGQSLSQITDSLQQFLMPPAKAAGHGLTFDRMWLPNQGWISENDE